MKKIFALFLLFSLCFTVYCQEEITGDMTTDDQETITKPYPLSIGISSGINYTGLFAISAEGNLFNNFCLNGNMGMGSWGLKAGLGMRYYKNYPKGLYYSLSFSHSSGAIDSLPIELTTTRSPNQAEEIYMNYYPVNNLNIGLGYQFKLGNRFRFNLEAGYSIILTKEPWKVETPTVELTQTSKQIMNMTAPGGFMLGLGFSVGLY